MVYSFNEIPSGKKRNKLLIYTTTQMDLKIIMLSERRQAKKECILYASIYIILGNANESIVKEDQWLPGDWGWGVQKTEIIKGHNETLGDDGYIHYL